MEPHEIRALIENVAAGKMAVAAAVDMLLDTMSRGGRIHMIDENLGQLGEALAILGYTVVNVEPGDSDDKIKKMLPHKIFITRNGKHFCDPIDMRKWEYGLIWVKTKLPSRELARRVEAVLMTSSFKKNLIQIVTV